MLGPRALAAEEARLRAAVALVAVVEAGPLSPLSARLECIVAVEILRYAALAPLTARDAREEVRGMRWTRRDRASSRCAG